MTELLQSGGELAFWQQSHEHDLHTVAEMWSALGARFQVLSETRAPCLYRYLCPVLMENDDGYAIAAQALHLLRVHNALTRNALREHDGREVKHTGRQGPVPGRPAAVFRVGQSHAQRLQPAYTALRRALAVRIIEV